MKKYIIILLSCVFFSFFLSAQSYEKNLEKYWQYRANLKTYFLNYSGNANVQGSHMPMENMTPWELNSNSLSYQANWGDGTWWLGHYWGVLALEYKLLKDNGQDYSETLSELRLALDTYYRLDFNAEPCWDDSSSTNGFYLKDDVPASMKDAIGATLISSNYIVSCNIKEGNYPSQDQVWAMFLGLRLVKDFVSESDLQSKVKDIAFLVTNRMQTYDGGLIHSPIWGIRNPVNGDLYDRDAVGSIGVMRYAWGKAASYLAGQNMDWAGSKNDFWRREWNICQNGYKIDNTESNWYGLHVLSLLINNAGNNYSNLYNWLVREYREMGEKRKYLYQPGLFPHLHLLALSLYGKSGANILPISEYEYYLDRAPANGNGYDFNLNGQRYTSPIPWQTTSLFCPWQDSPNGINNMLDYMMLFTAYVAAYKEEICPMNLTINGIINTDKSYIGQQIEVAAIITNNVKCSMFSGGIILNPGFELTKGAELTIKSSQNIANGVYFYKLNPTPISPFQIVKNALNP